MSSCMHGVNSCHQGQFSNFSIISERSTVPLTPPLSPQTLQPEATAGLFLGSDNLPNSEHFWWLDPQAVWELKAGTVLTFPKETRVSMSSPHTQSPGFDPSNSLNQVQTCTPTIPAFGGWRRESIEGHPLLHSAQGQLGLPKILSELWT